MMEQTKIYTALKGVRGRKPVNMKALEDVLVRFSYLVAEQPWIKEIDINPLLVSADDMTSLDARVVLHEAKSDEKDLPKLAIRPYPTKYVTDWKLKDGSPVKIRPIRPEDEPLMVEFHRNLSETTVNQRYMGMLQLEERIAHERLTRICFTDYDCEIPLVVDYKRQDGSHEILGVGRLNKVHGLDEAVFAIVISDPWQNKGLGTQLLQLLVRMGLQEKLSRITGHMLRDNEGMKRMCERVGFKVTTDKAQGGYKAEIDL
jgi:acetyltransferase